MSATGRVASPRSPAASGPVNGGEAESQTPDARSAWNGRSASGRSWSGYATRASPCSATSRRCCATPERSCARAKPRLPNALRSRRAARRSRHRRRRCSGAGRSCLVEPTTRDQQARPSGRGSGGPGGGCGCRRTRRPARFAPPTAARRGRSPGPNRSARASPRRRRRCSGVYSSTCSEIVGRGPTIAISPRTTLNRFGSSSSEVRRRSAPALVTLGSSLVRGSQIPPSGAPCVIVRSFHISNIAPSRPTRCWR